MPYHIKYENDRAAPLAITGMDLIVGSCDGIDHYKRTLYQGQVLFKPAPAARLQGIWRHTNPPVGAFVEPGIEALPQPLADESASKNLTIEEKLLVKVIFRAMQDAGLESTGPGREKPFEIPVAILYACEGRRNAAALNGQTSRLPAALSALMNVSGPILDISSDSCPLARGLLEAQTLLDRGNVEAAIIAASTYLEHLENTLLPFQSQLEQSLFTSGLSQSMKSWLVGDGAGAVVLMRRDEAAASGKRIYAVLDSLAFEGAAGTNTLDLFPPAATPGELTTALRQAIGWTGFAPQEIGAVEVFGGGQLAASEIEIADITRAAAPSGGSLACALANHQANTGYIFTTDGIEALIKTALSLSNRVHFPIPNWDAPKNLAAWEGTPYYVPTTPRAWFAQADETRHAALCLLSRDGHAGAAILSEEPQPAIQPAAWPSPVQHLLLVTASSPQEIISRLKLLRDSLVQAVDLQAFSRNQYQEYIESRDAASDSYCLALIGQDAVELDREIDYALKGIPPSIEKGVDWQTPVGSCFSPHPMGPDSEVAFVYPGAFNSYIGLGQDLLQVFPLLHDRALEIVDDPGAVFQEQMLYPRSLTALSKNELDVLEKQLLEDPIAMLTSGSGIAILYTMLLQGIFDLHPGAAFGYSLGENSMLFATGVWTEGADVVDALETSPLFHTRIAGPLNAVREYWKMPSLPANNRSETIWQNFVLMAPFEKVRETIAAEPKVYITHINAPRQVVIGGDPQGCRRTIESLKCSSLRAPFDYALHCEPMKSEHHALAGLLDWEIAHEPAMRLYTAATYAPLKIDREDVSKSITNMLCQPVDFPRLIQRVYADGAKVFVELGAGSNCARWIDETLKGEPHLAVSINRRGVDDYSAVLRTLAKLASHRVPLNLAPLYQLTPAAQVAQRAST